MKAFLFTLSFMCLVYADNVPEYIKQWQGKVYISTLNINGENVTQAFKISDNCYISKEVGDIDLFGKYYCEILYSQNGSDFDELSVNFYTEKPNDMNYSLVRVISIESNSKATIKVVSMEYANDFCNINVTRNNDTITLEHSKCKIDDLMLNNDIFHIYNKIK
ncbi:hypothetical protein DCO58_01845 [Helicobacter saguini]|uniref:Uncharacterized protein n=1 Tax=Helicobacter saguini TaxID=1548018 RepID=A0A347W072_9HELI|nr:hypothetical protein [Helicobacter saguini]MWV62876.1 hypothetical protein [Helicobacter saguini]MWV66454.1 hypothetical protein [Helicobacter saguini]MWV68803.1 hypothetical protein [Helicobacter saguini]MWV71642.1 hypothetical protein [Helicobacter saguini]TLD94445.1 hypothetical protein LS64_005825 [Helicobacter saguini]